MEHNIKQTQIVSNLSEYKEDNSVATKTSLLEKIENATTESEVNMLLETGKTYKKASHKTMKMWVKAAAKKIESFDFQIW